MVRTTPPSICVCVVLAVAPLSALAAPAPDAAAEPEAQDSASPDPESTEAPADEQLDRLIRDGGVAYNLGDFDAAIENFEAAYSLSPQPRLLYNVALAYFRRYDISTAGLDLQRAKALLTNFDIELQRDPTLGDSENVQRLIAQIDEKIAAHDQREALQREEAIRQEALSDAAEDECPVVPVTIAPDTTRGRTIGAALMGVGGASFAAGIASIAAFTIKGREFQNRLAVFEAERTGLGCSGSNPPAGCDAYDEPIAATITNGRRANIFAGAAGGTLTALGTAGLIAGAVVFAKSDKRSHSGDRRARVSVVPGLPGVMVVGRF